MGRQNKKRAAPDTGAPVVTSAGRGQTHAPFPANDRGLKAAKPPKNGVEVEEKWIQMSPQGIAAIVDFFRQDDPARMVDETAEPVTLLTLQLDKPGRPLARHGISLRIRGATQDNVSLDNTELCLKWAVPNPMEPDRAERYECSVDLENGLLPPDFAALLAKYDPANNPDNDPKVFERLREKVAQIEAFGGGFENCAVIRAVRRLYIVTFNQADRAQANLVAANKSFFMELIHDTVNFWDKETQTWCAEHDEMEVEVLSRQEHFVDPDGRYISQNLTRHDIFESLNLFKAIVARVGQGALAQTKLSKSERSYIFECMMEAQRQVHPDAAPPQQLDFPALLQGFIMGVPPPAKHSPV